MGLFDSLKIVGDIMKGAKASYKVCEQMDKMILRSRNEFKDKLSDKENTLYNEYMIIKGECNTASTTGNLDNQQDLNIKVEEAQVAYIKSLIKNKSLPQDFRDEMQTAVIELEKINSDIEKKAEQYNNK